MTTHKEALTLALKALKEIHVGNMTPMAEINWNKAITAIKEALAQQEQSSLNPLWLATHPDKLAQPEQEAAPVAKNEGGRITWMIDDWPQNCLLYTHTPPQRTWVELTDGDCLEALKALDPETKRLPLAVYMFAANIQAKLKEKNK